MHKKSNNALFRTACKKILENYGVVQNPGILKYVDQIFFCATRLALYVPLASLPSR